MAGLGNQQGPPPPPPPPGWRGGPIGPGPGPQFNAGLPAAGGGGGGGGGGPPPPPRPPGFPPGPPQQQNKVKSPNDTRYVDLTPKPKDTLLNEADYRKALITNEAHTIRKVKPRDPKKEKATWAKAEISKELLPQEEISRQIKKLHNSRKGSVSEKKQGLQHFQLGQVNRLLTELNDGEYDKNFEWSLVQLDQKIKSLKTGPGRETTTITCYCKRSLKPEIDPKGVYTALERIKQDRAQQMIKPPPLPQPPQQNGNALPPGVIKFPDNRGPIRAIKDRHGRKGHGGRKYYDESCSEGFDSDTDSRSSSSSSQDTSISSRSDHRNRKYSGHRGRARSHSRVRRNPLYIQDHMGADPVLRDTFASFGGGPRPSYVPEVPRGIPDYDPVAAAYQAGKVDADAVRFGVERAPIVRPIPIIEQPRAIVTYARPDTYEPPLVSYGYPDRHLSEPRIIDERYIDDLRYKDDLRYREEELRRDDRRRRDAEDYMEQRRAPEPRIISFSPNPFSPAHSRRQYSPSLDDYRDYRR